MLLKTENNNIVSMVKNSVMDFLYPRQLNTFGKGLVTPFSKLSWSSTKLGVPLHWQVIPSVASKEGLGSQQELVENVTLSYSHHKGIIATSF